MLLLLLLLLPAVLLLGHLLEACDRTLLVLLLGRMLTPLAPLLLLWVLLPPGLLHRLELSLLPPRPCAQVLHCSVRVLLHRAAHLLAVLLD